MSEKHLKAGDALPPYKGKLRLFGMRFCPFVEKSVLVLNAKGLDYELVLVHLHQKPTWLFDFNPKGTVPVLEYEEGKAIYDSNIINAYLDEKYPDKPVQASDPLRRAQDKLFVENFSAAQTAYFTAAFNSQALQPSHVENFHKGLEALQTELEARGTKYLHGAEPGWIDFTIWPLLERFPALPLLGKPEFAIDKSKYSLLTTYLEAMQSVPSVKSFYLAPETHAKFLQTTTTKDPDYNMLDTSDVACSRPRKK